MSISQNFPSSRPSLNLNFARAKKLDPRITFTRTSTATFVDEDGLVKSVATDTPRFEHNQSTGESLGLLVEESRTNLALQSESLNTTWSLGNVTISANTTATTAPDGTTNSDKIQEDNTNNQHLVFQSIGTPSIGAVYTFSCFFKAAERSEVSLTAHGEGYSVFNLSTGTITQTGGNSNVTITPYSNGWYRCSTTITKTNTNGVFYIVGWNGTNLYTGTTGSGIYAWGAQIEEGSFATSYIPTVASTVTRSADNASITRANFNSWYNPSEGSVVTIVNTASGIAPSAQVYCSISDGTENNRMVLYRPGGILRSEVAVTVSSVQTILFSTTGDTPNSSKYKMGFAYKINDMNAVFAGSISSGITTYSVPTSTQLNIGDRATGSRILNGSISQLIYYPVRLPNAQLQSLTSN